MSILRVVGIHLLFVLHSSQDILHHLLSTLRTNSHLLYIQLQGYLLCGFFPCGEKVFRCEPVFLRIGVVVVLGSEGGSGAMLLIFIADIAHMIM